MIPATSIQGSPSEYVGMFLDRYRDLQKSQNTIASYCADLAQLMEFSPSCRLSYQDADRFVAWLSQQGLSAASIKRKLSACRSFFTYLLRQGIVDVNPFLGVETPALPQRLPKLPSPEKVKECLDAMGDDYLSTRDGALIALLFGSGARISEALSLHTTHLDLNKNEIRVVGKGNKERVLVLSDGARRHLEGYLRVRPSSDTTALFLTLQGASLTRRGAEYAIERRFACVGEEVSPHQLRHSFASTVLDSGADIKIIQELLGHSSVAVTGRYLSVSVGRLHQAVAKAFE